MNILHFGCFYFPDRGGNVVRMSHMLENNNCKNKLFVLTTTKRGNFNDEEYYSSSGIKILRTENLHEAKLKLLNIVKKYEINIVVTHIIPANIIACSVLPKNIIIMTEIHSLIQSSTIKMIGKNLLHRLYLNKRTSCFFVLSRGAEKYIEQHYGVNHEKICFLPNGVYHNQLKAREKGNQQYFTFGYIGTFYNWQGTNIILENAEKIISIAKNVRLLMVGGGENENKYKILEKKYPGRIIVTGLITKNKADQMAKEIDVLLIPRPSTLESNTAIPLKIFETVQYGKPVIISNVFGLTEVFSDKEAFVYNNKTKDGLFNSCKYVYFHQDEMDNKYNNAIKKIKQWPTWDEIHMRQNEIFKKFL